MVVPKTSRQLGNRAFCVAGPVARNSLALDIRSAPLSTFKNMLKTHLFSLPTSLTNCFAEHEQRPLYGAFVVTNHVTVPYKL